MHDDDRARKELEKRIYWDVVSRSPDSWLKVILKMFAEPDYAKSIVRKHLAFPKSRRLLTTDRIVLEQQILQYYLSNPRIRDVLFVGCDADTARYERDHFSNVRFVTIEPNPDNRKFGAIHHVQAPLENLAKHFRPGYFDLIICNGVFGWGLDSFDDCQAAFGQCHACLRPDGHLLLGWNDVPRRTPFPLEQISSLSRFRKFDCPLFGTWRYLTDTPYRHTFDFYLK
jgi:SAM-dependent methyltransferase